VASLPPHSIAVPGFRVSGVSMPISRTAYVLRRVSSSERMRTVSPEIGPGNAERWVAQGGGCVEEQRV
jgi:hypothetical protein